MIKVQGLILIDGEEFVSITIDVDSEEAARILAAEMGAGISRGVVAAHDRYFDSDAGEQE